MRLAIDAMGNDRGPLPIVEGVKTFLEKNSDVCVSLVGNEDALRETMARAHLPLDDRVTIVHASQVMEMHDKLSGLREKRDSSIMRTVLEVKEDRADAMVALGNTAAAVGAATMGLRMLRGVHRAGIAVPMPTRTPGRPCVTIDMGANTVAKPRHLVDYGVMASIYAEHVLHVERPRVGLLNVGEERGKGNAMLREAFEALQDAPVNFIGNVEGRDIFNGACDVVVCDGFVGNVVLKASEELASTLFGWVREALQSSSLARLGGLLVRPALHNIKKQASYESYGGAPLLGLRKLCTIGHGRSSASAVVNALRVAREGVQVGLNDLIREQLASLADHNDESTETKVAAQS